MWKGSNTTSRLAAEEKQAAEITTRLSALDTELNAKLLAGDTAAVDKIDGETAGLRKDLERRQRTIGLLKTEIENQRRRENHKHRAAQAARVEAKIGERDQVVSELQERIGQVAVLFHRAVDLGSEAAMAWPFDVSDLISSKLTGAALRELVAYELYRVGTKPFFGGNPSEKAKSDLPGAASPNTDLMLQPEKIPSLKDTIADASAFAISVIRHAVNTKSAA